jgi:hypothetical protein
MIFEMRTYELKVGATQQYLKQFGEIGLPIVGRYCRLVGYWVAEGGRLNRVMHIWAFDSLEHRRIARERWWQDSEWIEKYLPLALPLVVSQESILLTAAPFSPIK